MELNTTTSNTRPRVRWVRCRALDRCFLAGRLHHRGDRLALLACEAAFIRRRRLAPIVAEIAYWREPGDRE